jgi:hypothetical protein
MPMPVRATQLFARAAISPAEYSATNDSALWREALPFGGVQARVTYCLLSLNRRAADESPLRQGGVKRLPLILDSNAKAGMSTKSGALCVRVVQARVLHGSVLGRGG